MELTLLSQGHKKLPIHLTYGSRFFSIRTSLLAQAVNANLSPTPLSRETHSLITSTGQRPLTNSQKKIIIMSLLHAAVLRAALNESDTSPPSSTFREKWDEIAASQDLKPGSPEFNVWSQQRTLAGHERLHELFFEGRSELEGFKAMCKRIGIERSPGTVVECCQALKDNLINIYDLIDAVETREEVLVWPIEQWNQFAKYTLLPENCYNLYEAKKSKILRCFLQRLRGRRGRGALDQRGGTYSLRGLPMVNLALMKSKHGRSEFGRPVAHRRSKLICFLPTVHQPPTAPQSSKDAVVDRADSTDNVDVNDSEDKCGDDVEKEVEAGILSWVSDDVEFDPSDIENGQSESADEQETNEPLIEAPTFTREPRTKRQRSPAPEWLFQAPNPKRVTIWNTTSSQAFSLRPSAADEMRKASRTQESLWLASSTPAGKSSLRTAMSFAVDPEDDFAPPPSAQPS
ncbi:hypothetical protein BD289DRAFT_39938 [Coniella lustricola]|uniref:Uncharacterized protein n=1 Tax=Coniella lustricola TaxID=2025994 RepID=A0A2T3AIV6_9PEZI|nr:hypothetical protein BD289DRAFT_39938 [Coniella lustricola]